MLGMSAPGSPNLTATYNGTAMSDLNNTIGALSGDSIVVTANNQGDATEVKNPLGGHTGITYDALRRPTYVTEFTLVPVPPYYYTSEPAPLMATRVTYDALGRTVKTERGSYLGATFTPLETRTVEFDAVGNKTKDIGP